MHTALADEVALIRDQVIQLANNRLGDTYLLPVTTRPQHLSRTMAPTRATAVPIVSGSGRHPRLPSRWMAIPFSRTPKNFFHTGRFADGPRKRRHVQIQNQTAPLARFQEHFRTFAQTSVSAGTNWRSAAIIWTRSSSTSKVSGGHRRGGSTEAVLALQLQNTVYEAALVAAADLLRRACFNFYDKR